MKPSICYSYPALIVAGAFIASMATAGDPPASQKPDPEMEEMMKKAEAAPAEPTTKECPYCATAVPIKAVRCPHCTSELKK